MVLDNFRAQKIIWDRANKKIFEKIEANSGDSNGRKLVVQVINQGVTEGLSGTTLSLGWKSRKGAKGLDAFNVVDASKGIFEIYYTTEMLSNIGNVEASFILIDSTSRIESSTFTISLRPSTVDDESVESENSFTALTEALVKVNDLEDNYAPRLNEVTAQLAQKADSVQAQSIQNQVNSLVLGSVGDGNNPEVVQARGRMPVLNDRLTNIDYNFIDTFESGGLEETFDYRSNTTSGTSSNYMYTNDIMYRENLLLKSLDIQLSSPTVMSAVLTIVLSDSTHTIYDMMDAPIEGISTSAKTHTLRNLNMYIRKDSYVSIFSKNKDIVFYYDRTKAGDNILGTPITNVLTLSSVIDYAQTVPGLLSYQISGLSLSKGLERLTDASSLSQLIKESKRLYGKKIVAIGDSMVEGHTLTDEKTWLHKLATRNDMSYANYGINGTFLTNRLYNGTHSGVVDRYKEMDDDAEYLVVFAGTNDAGNRVEIGASDSENPAEFKGALNILCEGLISKYPTSKILFITPYLRNANYPPYIEAIEEICSKYGIKVFNNAKEGGVDWSNAAQVNALTMGDTYHLNERGMEYASYKYESKLESM